MAAAEERRPPLAAYYVQRSLEGCPGATPLPQLAQVGPAIAWACATDFRCLQGWPALGPIAAHKLSSLPCLRGVQGLATVMEALPVRSPVALLCLQQVLDKCWELAAW